MNMRFTRLDVIATAFLCAVYSLLMAALCTVATGRPQVQVTLWLLIGILCLVYLVFGGVRLRPPMLSLCTGVILGVLVWSGFLTVMISEGDSLSTITLASLISLLVVVLPTALLAVAFAWTERGSHPRIKLISRCIVFMLFLGTATLAGFMGWKAWDEYSPGKYGQNVEFRVLAQIGKHGLTEQLVSQSAGIESPPAGYIWIPSEVTELDDSAIGLEHDGQLYVLLHNLPPWIMTHESNAQPWAIKNAHVEEASLPSTTSGAGRNHDSGYVENFESVRISLLMRLDCRGGEQLESLTKQCRSDSHFVDEFHQLGIVVSGKLVHSAAVREVLSASSMSSIGIEMGTASSQDGEELQALRTRADALCREMRR
jgi:hypothetical protein